MPRLRFRSKPRTAQKETALIPKLNRMPDGSLGVKAGTPNCHTTLEMSPLSSSSQQELCQGTLLMWVQGDTFNVVRHMKADSGARIATLAQLIALLQNGAWRCLAFASETKRVLGLWQGVAHRISRRKRAAIVTHRPMPPTLPKALHRIQITCSISDT
jgi:hypothetical protein